MVDLPSFADSLKCKWVKKYLQEDFAFWKVLFDNELKNYRGKFLFECNYSKKDVIIENRFIYDVCCAWSSFDFRPQMFTQINVFLKTHILRLTRNLSIPKHL